MKHLGKYITEKETTGSGSIQMIQSILDELKNKHNDCSYDAEKNAYTGKDADLWKGAGQFLYDYVKELEQNDLKKIVDYFGWENNIENINDIKPQEISMCIAVELNK